MIPNHSVIVSVTEPKGKNRKKVWFRKGDNLLDLSTFGFTSQKRNNNNKK